ncbi:MAG: hypothetical protein ACYDA1_01985 [Vulcanimicrobiaceae bacterium]
MYAPQLLRRRWPVYVAIIAVAGIIDAMFPNPNTRFLVDQIAGATAVFFMLIDTMVLDDPHVEIARGLFWRLFLLTLWLILISLFLLILCYISAMIIGYGFIHLRIHIVSRLFIVILAAIFAFAYTRMAFIYFAIVPEHRSEISFETSWRLTSRSAFLPTFTFTAISVVPIFLIDIALQHLLVPRTIGFAFICVNMLYALVTLPILLQWMHACERINA